MFFFYNFSFKWTNLTERLAYEKAVHQQRMRTEISQAKRETDYFKANVEKSKRMKLEKEQNDWTNPHLHVAKKSHKVSSYFLNSNPRKSFPLIT